ncbi:MAG TPA: hypothetical protein DG761_01315 [Gammaproteobacteria bacterium]|nr:hypothetical protein [Gammaproteobacteria bacterium]
MNVLRKLWILLDDRKTQVAAVMNLVLAFAIGRGWLAEDTIGLLTALLLLWTGGAIAHHEVKKLNKKGGNGDAKD